MSGEPPNPRGERLSVQQASRYLDVPVATVYRLVAERKLPHYRIGPARNGAHIWFYARELDAWLDAQRVPVARSRDDHRLHAPTTGGAERPTGIEDLLPRERVFG